MVFWRVRMRPAVRVVILSLEAGPDDKTDSGPAKQAEPQSQEVPALVKMAQVSQSRDVGARQGRYISRTSSQQQ